MHAALELVTGQHLRPVPPVKDFYRLISGNRDRNFSSDTLESTKPEEPLSPATVKILLVEDNPINQKVALRILKHHGFEADTADNGKEALAAFDNKIYDVVLMDIQMPVMDGISATRSIRSKYGGQGPYIIAVTANATDEDRRNCFDAGMNDFVTKPIRSDVLAAAIFKFLPSENRDQN